MREPVKLMMERGLSLREAQVAAAILCCYPDSSVQQLIGWVWPYGDEPDNAAANIGRVLFMIRRKASVTGIDVPWVGAGHRGPAGYSLVIKRNPNHAISVCDTGSDLPGRLLRSEPQSRPAQHVPFLPGEYLVG